MASGQNRTSVLPVHSQNSEPRAVITLDPPTGWDLQVHTFNTYGNRLPEAPANFRRFGDAKAGEPGDLHTLKLRFSETVTLHHLKSTADFPISPGGSCVEGGVYEAKSTCTVLVRFTPQGPGHRLGSLNIEHSEGIAQIGLGGNGSIPVVSFTPSLITTVPVTVVSGAGVISGATSLAVDGGDTLYIADTGNQLLRKIDSSGTLTSITPGFGGAPDSVAVDSMGNAYTNQSGSQYYFSVYLLGGSQNAWFNTYKPGTCTVSSPCQLGTVGMGSPADFSMDANDNLFLEEATEGAAEMPVADYFGGGLAENPSIWYLDDAFGFNGQSFGVDASDNLYTAYTSSYLNFCYIVQEALYGAEVGAPVYNRVAGGTKCGYSGDGGQAANAEISTSIGQFAFDHAGNMYFADAGNQRIRRIDAATGIIRTIAGNGTAGYKGDNGLATAAELDAPTGVGVDSQGQVYILSNSATTGTAQVVRKVETTGALTFPSTTEGVASATLVINVANTGNNTLSFVRQTINGTDPGDFTVDPNTTSCNFAAGNYLEGGADCQIGVIFKPAATGARTATINLIDNTVNNVNQIKLTGTGVATAVVKFTSPTAKVSSGTELSLAVTVTSSKTPAPTGKISFSVDGKSAGSATIDDGKASVEISGVAAGTHSLLASYPGDKDHAAAKATETLTVSK
jgi:large repetitive protein